MTNPINERHYTNARFWKCALQVNSHVYRGSYRGQDHGMDAETYAEALRDVCLEEGIQVVGFADHGSVADAEDARSVLSKEGIVVFPGFEVETSEKVHWVCLFPEDTAKEELQLYLGRLHLTDPQDGARPTDLSGQDMFKVVEEIGGFCYAAHATSDKGVLKEKQDNLWIDSLLRAAQIPGKVEDLPLKYKSAALNKNPEYKRERPVALINAKDVATPEDLRKQRASTFIKMTRPCFASFLMAFKDPESRVRLCDDMVERHYSRIDKIHIEGGYFDGLSAEISGHLNAVIGGRGTGKSTLLECIRYALDIPHKGGDAKQQGEQIVKENLGRAGGRVTLELRSAANHMQSYTVIRRYGEPSRVTDHQGNESHLHPGRDLLPGVEIYGQNEIYELARSPKALTQILDRFLPEGAEQESQLHAAYRALRENGKQLAKALERQDEAERQIMQLPRLEEQARQFKEQGLEDQLKQVPLLEKERRLGPRILEETERVRSGQRELQESLPDLVFLSDKALERLPHAVLLRRGRKILETLGVKLRHKLDEIDEAIGNAETALGSLVDALTKAMEAAESQLEKEFAKLPAVAGKSGREVGHAYQRLLREIERVKPGQTRLKTVDALVEELERRRRNLLDEISDLRSARTDAKQGAVKKLNKRLAGKLRITLVRNGLRQPLRDYLQGLHGMGRRRTEWVDKVQDLTIPGLVDVIQEGRDALLGKNWGLTSGSAETLAKMAPEQLHELEEIDLQDRIKLELNVSHSDESFKSLDHLSTGQQCTAILHLLLLDNQDPLIIDQPEDNLDNAFIAERIVQELRSAKTERQFLFATHNANIPVFGDAEWIGACAASENQARMPKDAQGSIDTPKIRDQVASLLEGGRDAFVQRKEKYGF